MDGIKPKILDTGLRRHDDISSLSDHRLNSKALGGRSTDKSAFMVDGECTVFMKSGALPYLAKSADWS
jgi:hypothetical protein